MHFANHNIFKAIYKIVYKKYQIIYLRCATKAGYWTILRLFFIVVPGPIPTPHFKFHFRSLPLHISLFFRAVVILRQRCPSYGIHGRRVPLVCTSVSESRFRAKWILLLAAPIHCQQPSAPGKVSQLKMLSGNEFVLQSVHRSASRSFQGKIKKGGLCFHVRLWYWS